MSGSHDESPGKLTPASVFERLLRFMDAPWKAGVVIILVVIGGLGWLLYDQRARIADRILRDPITVATLNPLRFSKDAMDLLRETRGDVTILADVQLADNVVIDRVGFTRDGVLWVPIEGPQPAIVAGGDTALIARFLRNEVICLDTSKAVNEESRTLRMNGYTRVCMVQVPPVLGVGVGGLIVAWKVALELGAEQRAGLVMQVAAMKFATW